MASDVRLRQNSPRRPDAEEAPANSLSGISLPEMDVEALLAKAGTILQREISNLMIESTGKKLSATSARDLTAYIKLLSELKESQEKELRDLTDEELAARIVKNK